MKKKYSNKEIVAQIKTGNTRDVLQFIYATSRKKLVNWIRRNNGSKDQAQDIFQEAVIKFYEYVLADKFDEEKSVDGFLFTIGKNLWINQNKRKKEFHLEEIDPYNQLGGNDPEIMDLLDEGNDIVGRLMNSIGIRCKKLLTYSVFYKMNMKEIAERLELSNENSAKTQNYKCKKKMMKMIKESESIQQYLSR